MELLNLLAHKEGQIEAVVNSRMILCTKLKFVRTDKYIFANFTQNFTNFSQKSNVKKVRAKI